MGCRSLALITTCSMHSQLRPDRLIAHPAAAVLPQVQQPRPAVLPAAVCQQPGRQPGSEGLGGAGGAWGAAPAAAYHRAAPLPAPSCQVGQRISGMQHENLPNSRGASFGRCDGLSGVVWGRHAPQSCRKLPHQALLSCRNRKGQNHHNSCCILHGMDVRSRS